MYLVMFKINKNFLDENMGENFCQPSVETIRCKRNRCHRDAHQTAPAYQGLNCWCSCIGDSHCYRR
jgi:hypothetical protein